MILEKLKEIISSKTGIREEEITEDSVISEDFDLDSIDLFEILSEIEDEFSIEIEEEDYDKIKTIDNLIDYIEEKKED